MHVKNSLNFTQSIRNNVIRVLNRTVIHCRSFESILIKIKKDITILLYVQMGGFAFLGQSRSWFDRIQKKEVIFC